MANSCFCGAPSPFELCCKPYLSGTMQPATAEILMRSRYSAYANGQFKYIWETYSQTKRHNITLEEIQKDATGTKWLSLKVEQHSSTDESATVTFRAFYQHYKQFFQMHELSNFLKEQGNWRYIDGTILSDSGEIKLERNSLCICNSGKKFKKCCAIKSNYR